MFEFFKKKTMEKKGGSLKSLLEKIHKSTGHVFSANDLNGVKEYEDLKKLPDHKQREIINQFTELILEFSLKQVKARDKGHFTYSHNEMVYYGKNIACAIQNGLMRRKLNYDETAWINMFKSFKHTADQLAGFESYYFDFHYFPINYGIKQIEYFLKNNERSKALTVFIQEMLTWEEFKASENRNYYGSDLEKAAKKLQSLVLEEGKIPSFSLKTNDIGDEVNQIIDAIQTNREAFDQIFDLASTATSSKPSKKFSQTVTKLQDEIGPDQYKKTAHQLLNVPLHRAFDEKTTTHEYNGRTYHHTQTTYLCTPSQRFIKGIVWTMERFSDKETIRLLSKLCEKGYTKMPGIGPAAASVGNAAVFVLGNMRGKDGLGALSRLKLKVRQNNIKKSIEKYLLEGAQKYNVSVEELKEMAVPDFHLEKGSKTIKFNEYQLKISIEGNKVRQQFIKNDGTPLKSVPSAVKNSASLSGKLKEIRKEAKEIQTVFAAQKQRMDNQLILNRSWDYHSFTKYHLDHGLIYPIASFLIWNFTKGEKTADVILLDGKWYTVDHDLVDWIDEEAEVKLWHPVNASEATILAWREKMIDLEWKQPIKQAFREIYILTDAELNTRSYSNRMAAHILKQHQFSTLASLRDWKYALMGAYDDGRDNETCQKYLREYGITAEYWINELYQDGDWNDAGIWLHIATDQVKFKNDHGETMQLVDVPKIVFSEIMRDVDLFVGVCSVGNDPQWMDNNGARQANRDYWHSYSFGDLNEIAKTRKTILEQLLPRLTKIRDKAKIDGKFLTVKGKLRTYKIHIGSGNILMEPNDQYLCIVPARSSGSATDRVFIPFEGDQGLSIVLSKAFLLAEDDKITDSTITSQISR